jgi:hypothetical protein
MYDYYENRRKPKNSIYVDFTTGFISVKSAALEEGHTVTDKDALASRKSAILEMIGFGNHDLMRINHLMTCYLDGVISEEKFKILFDREFSFLKETAQKKSDKKHKCLLADMGDDKFQP